MIFQATHQSNGGTREGLLLDSCGMLHKEILKKVVAAELIQTPT